MHATDFDLVRHLVMRDQQHQRGITAQLLQPLSFGDSEKFVVQSLLRLQVRRWVRLCLVYVHEGIVDALPERHALGETEEDVRHVANGRVVESACNW